MPARRASTVWLLATLASLAIAWTNLSFAQVAGEAPAVGFPPLQRVRVPSELLGAGPPAGKDWRVLRESELSRLVEQARRGHAARVAPGAPRLLRARHTARWESGVLVGRSSLLFAPPTRAPAWAPLDPWSPAIEPASAEGARIVARDDGSILVRLDSPGLNEIQIAWRLTARAGSEGRDFALDLPEIDSASLELDLPESLVPEGVVGQREGPVDAPEAGRKVWRFDGPGGPASLRIRAGEGVAPDPTQAAPWVVANTQFQVDEASARWRTEWSIESGLMGDEVLVSLDSGMDWTNVTGPDLVSVEAVDDAGLVRPMAGRRLARLRLRTRPDAPSLIRFEGVAQLPDLEGGDWTLPTLRPIGGQWLGGRVAVAVAPVWEVADVVELAGRRVAPGEMTGSPTSEPMPPTPPSSAVLAFEQPLPEPVARVSLRRSTRPSAARVDGILHLGSERPRFEAGVRWTGPSRPAQTIEIGISPGWMPQSVELVGSRLAGRWVSERHSDGSRSIWVVVPAGNTGEAEIRVTGWAEADDTEPAGSFRLPRVAPVGATLEDELWIAQGELGTYLNPVHENGLAWLAPGDTASGRVPAFLRLEGLNTVGAWRWVEKQASARVSIGSRGNSDSAEVEQVVRLDGDHLVVEWGISLDRSSAPLTGLPIEVMGSVVATPEWRLAAGSSEQRLELSKVSPEAGSAEPRTSTRWLLRLPPAQDGTTRLRGRLRLPWPGRGTLPLIHLPTIRSERGTVAILVPPSLALDVASSLDFRELEAASAWSRMALRSSTTSTEADLRPTYAFAYLGEPGRIDVATRALSVAPTQGYIAEANLTTLDFSGESIRQQLTFSVMGATEQPLELRLPPGARLEQMTLDGRPFVPARVGGALSVTLDRDEPGTQASRSILDLRYTIPSEGSRTWPLPLDRPQFSLPCLGLSWRVIVPPDTAFVGGDPRLIDQTPGAADDAARSLLTGPLPSNDPISTLARLRARRAALESEQAMQRELGALIAATPAGERSLAEWLTLWDSGRWPLIVDRLAVSSAGWSPASRVSRAEQGNGAQPSPLASVGLRLVPVGGVALVTSAMGGPNLDRMPIADRRAWESAMREAVAWGSDHAHRFCTVGRWRSEAAPAAPSRAHGRSLVSSGTSGELWLGLPRWDLAKAGVRLVAPRPRVALGWALSLALVGVGWLARNAAPRAQAAAVILLSIAGILLLGLGRADAVLGGGAILRGLVLAASFRLGGLGRDRAERVSVMSARSTVPASWRRAIQSSLRIGAVLVLLGALEAAVKGVEPAIPQAAPADSSPKPRGDEPIVVLVPFRGVPPETTDPAALVWISEVDHQRLLQLAKTPATAGIAWTAATRCEHRLRRETERDVAIVSRYDLILVGEGAASWSIPLGDARDFTAECDGKPVPATVEGASRIARVRLDQITPGRHTLVVRRRFRASRDELGDFLVAPINRVATSFAVAEPPVAPAPVATPSFPAARGLPLDTAPNGETGAWIGPVNRLEVRWDVAATTDEPKPRGAVDGLLLWHIEAAGDELLARWTVRVGEAVARLRIALGPGVLVRSVTSGNRVVEGRLDVSRPQREWFAQFDPPLPDGAELTIRAWRPLRESEEGDRESIPELRPLGIERYAGSIAAVRPADWSGRLDPMAGTEPISEETFDRLWGGLELSGGTLAGTTRFVGPPVVRLASRPPRVQRRIEGRLTLRVEPGRVGWTYNATLNDRGLALAPLEAELPSGLRIVSATATGLTSWSAEPGGRLQMRFDGAPIAQRTIELSGWIPAPDLGGAGESAVRELPVPWPVWRGLDPLPGDVTLSTSAQVAAALRDGAGQIIPLVAEPEAQAAGSVRAPRVDGSARLAWSVYPAVRVQVFSLFDLDSRSASWTTWVRYQVAGGSYDRLQLKLPRAWADQATFELEGQGLLEPVRESGIATLRPARPLWGEATLIVRARQNYEAAATVEVPELVPLGRGVVETFLMVVSPDGLDPSAGDIRGLEPVNFEALPATRPSLPATMRPVCYRVRREGWSMRLAAPRAGKPSGAANAAIVALADLVAVAELDGRVHGVLRCELEPSSAPFLEIHAPTGLEPLAAVVDGRPVRPLNGEPNRWLLPVRDARSRRVELAWQSAPGPTQASGVRSIDVPSPTSPRVPMLITIHAPESARIEASDGPIVATMASWQDAERVTIRARRLVAALTASAGNAAAIEAIGPELARFEAELRSAERACRWAEDSRGSLAAESQRQALRRIEQVRGQVEAAYRLTAARFASSDPGRSSRRAEATEGEAATLPIVRLGRPSHFRWEADRPGSPPRLRWTTMQTDPGPRPFGPLTLAACLAAFAALGLSWLTSEKFGPAITLVASCAALAALAPQFAMGTLPVAAIVGLIGRSKRTDPTRA